MTEMGRGCQGVDLPPGKINIVRKGRYYGWPTCYGKSLNDSDFDPGPASSDPCEGKTPRPAGLACGGYGVPCLSDDYAGLVYRIEHLGD